MRGPSQRDTRITSDRLVLRAPIRSDYLAWSNGRRESRSHLEPWEPVWPRDALSREDWSRRLRAWKAGWRDDRAYVFLVFKLGSEHLVGGISATNVRRGPSQSCALGYWLLSGATGEGYMREAVRALSDWCFDTLGLQRIEAGTLPENAKSQAVLEGAGFTREGELRKYLEINGARRDHILYACLKEDPRP